MICLKNEEELQQMRRCGAIAAAALKAVEEQLRPGMTTAAVNKIVHTVIVSAGAKPSFKGYHGFPASACVSLNDEIIHGIPAHDRVIHEGDLVKVDVGAFLGGVHTDCAQTYAVGHVTEEAERLIRITRESFYAGVAFCRAGGRLGDVSSAIQQTAEAAGFSLVREYTGHGVGFALHEDPSVPNFGTAGRGVRLANGMTLAIEPMVNAGTRKILAMPDGWTVKTGDGALSAHYERTVAITPDGPEILTKVGDEI
ncbi:MAG: type I methionyl aminopeptidase [Clostridia bacterium]|nr:type I methionyl aminopeptidase [Clostridia bacterium]